MGSDRRTFFNQLVNVGALSGLAAMLPSDALAQVETSIREDTSASTVALDAGNDTTRTHTFHAHAHIFQSQADHALTRQLGNQRTIRLPDGGGFRSQFVDGHASGGISFKSAYMQVAGTRSSTAGYGWVTLATSVITGLNIHGIVLPTLYLPKCQQSIHGKGMCLPSRSWVHALRTCGMVGKRWNPYSTWAFVD